MPYDVVMPQLGLTMTEGSVTSWLKAAGDRVEKGEPLFTVETDKVEMEVESVRAGYLSVILVERGRVVPVGTVIARLVDDRVEVGNPMIAAPLECASQPWEPRKSALPEVGGQQAVMPDPLNDYLIPTRLSVGEAFPASPRARRLAQALKVDIRQITPSRGERIAEQDVRRHYEASHSIEAPEGHQDSGDQAVRSLARRMIASRTTESFQTAPHFYLGVEANASEIVKLRESLFTGPNLRGGKLTYTDLFLRALAIALVEQPDVNKYWEDGRIRRWESVDLGVAVQTSETLLVPILRNTAALSLFDLAQRRHELTERARSGKLTLRETEGGSATLTNLGPHGVDWFQAILNPPQSVILAVGQIAKRPLVVAGGLEACPSVKLTLSVDHRVLDGVSGAAFLQRIRELIENPYNLIV